MFLFCFFLRTHSTNSLYFQFTEGQGRIEGKRMWVFLFCPFYLCHHHFHHKCLVNIRKYISKKGYNKASWLFLFLRTPYHCLHIQSKFQLERKTSPPRAYNSSGSIICGNSARLTVSTGLVYLLQNPVTLSFGSNGILCLWGIVTAINEQSGKE